MRRLLNCNLLIRTPVRRSRHPVKETQQDVFLERLKAQGRLWLPSGRVALLFLSWERRMNFEIGKGLYYRTSKEEAEARDLRRVVQLEVI